MSWLKEPTESGYWWWKIEPNDPQPTIVSVEVDPRVRLVYEIGMVSGVDLDGWLREFPAGEWQQVREPDTD